MARTLKTELEAWLEMASLTSYNAGLLSRKLRISRRQLQRYTQELFRQSPQEWLDEQRLNAAAQLLQSGELVKVVAFQLGFKQVSHFSRKFKEHHGVAPRDFTGPARGRTFHVEQMLKDQGAGFDVRDR